jgi:hypothetical protein
MDPLSREYEVFRLWIHGIPPQRGARSMYVTILENRDYGKNFYGDVKSTGFCLSFVAPCSQFFFTIFDTGCKKERYRARLD